MNTLKEKEKLNKLLDILKDFSQKDIEKLEKLDRQYRALEKLYKNLKDEKLFFKLVLINALMSYQLQMKGEDYWEIFSKFFSENQNINDFERFITLYNKRFLNAKIKRLKKVISCVEKLFNFYCIKHFEKNLYLLVKKLSTCLSQKEDAKTIVFAAKMFMYAYKIVYNKKPKGLENIFIPLDVRLLKISKNKDFWLNLFKNTNFSPIELDVLLWVPQNLDKKTLNSLDENLRKKIKRFMTFLNAIK